MVDRCPCPRCQSQGKDTSGDNAARYDDGHVYCFACGYHQNGDGSEIVSTAPKVAANWDPLKGSVRALTHRSIRAEVCERYGYRMGKRGDDVLEIADYVRDGELIGQKIRNTKTKQFYCKGNMRDAPMFGQQTCRMGGRRIIVTEGEIDAMSAFQALQCKWPVVSIPNGANAAADAFRRNLEFLNSYEEVVIAFDSDEPGLKAAYEAAQILKPGKAKIASLSMKDPNEFLKAGRSADLASQLWEAQAYSPDGIVHVKDVKADKDDIGKVFDYPWESMTRKLYGRRSGELMMHTSGSGMGKSTVMRSMIHHDISEGVKTGVLMLEESTSDTKHDLMSLEVGKPIRKIMAMRRINAARAANGKKPLEFDVIDDLTDEEYERARLAIESKPLFLYDHFGSQDADTLLARLDYLVTGLGCERIYLDHVSIVISGLESGNERKDIDVLMTKLRAFVQQTGVRMEAVCHLRKPDGTPFEEGGQISSRDLRGSGSLYQLSDGVLAYERNQQDPDRERANTIMVRSLKDRLGGFTGLCSALRYDPTTMRLNEVPWTMDDEGRPMFGPSKSTAAFEPEPGWDASEPVPEDGVAALV